MPGLHLNQLIEASLSGARAGAMEKIAQEAESKACKACGRPTAAGSDMCKACAEKAAKGEERAAQTEGSEKTSSENIKKMASAVRWMVQNPRAWLSGIGHLKAAEEATNTTGPGRGPNTLETNVSSPTTEEMPATLNPGGAAKHSIPTTPPMEAGANPKAAPKTMKTDIDKARPLQPKDGDLIQKGAAAVQRLKQAMLKKAEDGDSASVTTPKTSALPEEQPSQVARPAEVTSQERMIASNEAAINFTKRDAKAVPKKRMGEVLDEPAQSKAGDSALQDAVGADLAAKGGAKVASAKLMQKLASEGCTCEDGSKGSCGYCEIASQMEQELRGRAGAQIAAAQGTVQ